jgi:hypothetical protein
MLCGSLTNLVEVKRLQVECVEEPGEGALAVVGKDDHLQASGEQSLTQLTSFRNILLISVWDQSQDIISPCRCVAVKKIHEVVYRLCYVY